MTTPRAKRPDGTARQPSLLYCCNLSYHTIPALYRTHVRIAHFPCGLRWRTWLTRASLGRSIRSGRSSSPRSSSSRSVGCCCVYLRLAFPGRQSGSDSARFSAWLGFGTLVCLKGREFFHTPRVLAVSPAATYVLSSCCRGEQRSKVPAASPTATKHVKLLLLLWKTRCARQNPCCVSTVRRRQMAW